MICNGMILYNTSYLMNKDFIVIDFLFYNLAYISIDILEEK